MERILAEGQPSLSETSHHASVCGAAGQQDVLLHWSSEFGGRGIEEEKDRSPDWIEFLLKFALLFKCQRKQIIRRWLNGVGRFIFKVYSLSRSTGALFPFLLFKDAPFLELDFRARLIAFPNARCLMCRYSFMTGDGRCLGQQHLDSNFGKEKRGKVR